MDELSTRRIHNVIQVLTEQRNTLQAGSLAFAAHLVDLAIMQLRLSLNEISDDEFCEISNAVSLSLVAGDRPD